MPIRGALAGQRACRGAGSLVGPAVSLLLSAHGQAAWPFGPLVLVAPSPAAASAVVTACGQRDAADVFWGDGRTLGREIAAATHADRADRLAGLFAARRLAVIDDLDALGGPERQLAFVQLFDAATARGCRFCVSLRAHPAHAGLEPQLASRLCAGLVLFAAGPATPSRRMAGGREPSLGRIIRVVAARRELAVSDLTGPSRRHTVAAARALAMHLARGLTSKSLDEIGAAFGGRDHTTVMHALKVVSERILHDAGLAADIEHCRARLAGPIVDLARGRRRPVASPSARLSPGA